MHPVKPQQTIWSNWLVLECLLVWSLTKRKGSKKLYKWWRATSNRFIILFWRAIKYVLWCEISVSTRSTCLYRIGKDCSSKVVNSVAIGYSVLSKNNRVLIWYFRQVIKKPKTIQASVTLLDRLIIVLEKSTEDDVQGWQNSINWLHLKN